jgi:hypothetical protein
MNNRTYTANGKTFSLEQFIPNSYRVRLVIDDNTSISIGLLTRKSNPNYDPRRVNLQGDLNAGRKYQFVWKKTGRSLNDAINPFADCTTIQESLDAIKPEWIAALESADI